MGGCAIAVQDTVLDLEFAGLAMQGIADGLGKRLAIIRMYRGEERLVGERRVRGDAAQRRNERRAGQVAFAQAPFPNAQAGNQLRLLQFILAVA